MQCRATVTASPIQQKRRPSGPLATGWPAPRQHRVSPQRSGLAKLHQQPYGYALRCPALNVQPSCCTDTQPQPRRQCKCVTVCHSCSAAQQHSTVSRPSGVSVIAHNSQPEPGAVIETSGPWPEPCSAFSRVSRCLSTLAMSLVCYAPSLLHALNTSAAATESVIE